MRFLVNQLRELYASNVHIMYSLTEAENLLKNRNISVSADMIQKILVDRELNKTNLKIHKIIIENARKFAYQNLILQAGYNIYGMGVFIFWGIWLGNANLGFLLILLGGSSSGGFVKHKQPMSSHDRFNRKSYN